MDLGLAQISRMGAAPVPLGVKCHATSELIVPQDRFRLLWVRKYRGRPPVVVEAAGGLRPAPFQFFDKSFRFGRRIVKPIGRPDSDKIPAEPLEHLFAEAVAIARAPARMIARPITFDTGKKHLAVIRVANAKIDLITGNTDLVDNVIAATAQTIRHFYLEVAVWLPDRLYHRTPPRFGVFEIALKNLHTLVTPFGRFYIRRSERCENAHAHARARKEDIETPMTLLPIYGPEPLLHGSGARLTAIREGDEYKIPLVSLNVLKILYKDFVSL